MLYKNKYRIESARLRNWDYSTPGYYYVTICTYDRKQHFGPITHRNRIMNEAETRAEFIDPALKTAGWGAVEGFKVLRGIDITAGKNQVGGVSCNQVNIFHEYFFRNY